MKNNKLNPKNLINFLYASIEDIQSTIRAIDTKLGLLLIVIVIPISENEMLYNKIKATFLNETVDLKLKILSLVIMIVFYLFWALAFFTTFKGIMTVQNPRKHIKKNLKFEKSLSGSFYRKHLYKFNFLNLIFTGLNKSGFKNLEELYENLPKNNDLIIKELLFEQTKLAYVRDIKTLRQAFAFRFTFVWVILIFVIYMFY
jgi:hypothetical protein